jgi:signal peptidase
VIRLGALTAVAGLLFWAVAPTVFGWRAALIISGSMEPGIRAGDLVILAPINPDQLKEMEVKGLVVQVRNPVRHGELLVHRAVGKTSTGAVITKGDANVARDYEPVPPKDVLGVGRVRVPFVGLPVLWLHNGERVPLLALAGVLLALIWPDRKTAAAEPAGGPAGEPAVEPAGEPAGEPATAPAGEPAQAAQTGADRHQ